MRVVALVLPSLIAAFVIACSGATSETPTAMPAVPTPTNTPPFPIPTVPDPTPTIPTPGPTPRPLATSVSEPTVVAPTSTLEIVASPTAVNTTTPTTVPTPTPTALPATSTPVPIPTASPVPVPTATPTPTVVAVTPTPTPTPTPKINLRPTSPGAGQLPMSVHASLSSTEPGDLRTGGDAYLDWAIENNSPFPTENEFETHVYVDDVFVGRWVSSQSPPFQTFGVWDSESLNTQIKLDRGDHVFKLVVDALDQINETDETDNIFERTYTWAGESLVPPTPGSRSINLTLEPTSERNEAVVAAAVAESPDSGPLTVDAPTFVTWGVTNNGLASTDDAISVHVSLDGILVDRRIIGGLSALSRSSLVDWAELGDMVNITPGEHTLEVAIDPGNLIDESDETDNTFTAVLTWETGPAIPPDTLPEPTPASVPHYEELLRANLATTTLPSDWDATLVIRSATSGASQTGRNGHVSAFTAGIVDYAIANSSPVSTLVDFSTRVLLDNIVIDDSRFAGAGSSGSLWLVDVAIPANRLTPGTHTLRLEIDSGAEVNEFDETDNSLTYDFEVASGPAPPVIPTTYTDEELAEMLAVVPDLLLETSALDAASESETDWLAIVSTVADAAYFLVTGTALQDERIEISLLSRAEYESQNLTTCLLGQNSLTRSEYDTTLENCQTTIGSSGGLTWPGTGVVKVRVDASSTPAGTLSMLLHELGHARKTLLLPAGTISIPSDASSAIGEAQAQVFEAVGMRYIEEFLGDNFTRYPDLSVLQDDVSDLIDYHSERAGEHSLGYKLMWLAALQNVGGLGMADELRTTGVLSAASALDFYNYLVNISDQEAVAWVSARLASSANFIEEFRQITLGRLVNSLPAESEGHPHLMDLAFLAP